MIDRELLEILACPEDKSAVKLADAALVERLNESIRKKAIKNRGGQVVTEEMSGGLVRADGRYLYPVRQDIPIMLIDEAIPLV